MTPETVEKRADFYAQDGTGSTIEIRVSHEIKTEPKSIAFLLEFHLSHIGSSRRQTIRLNGMEFCSLLATLQDNLDRAYIASLKALSPVAPQAEADAPQFGHVFDEPVDTLAGSTAESMLLGELAAAELAERNARTVEPTPDALDVLADKLVTIFEAEDAAKGVAVGGSAIGDDDGSMLDGEVA